jgi:hypothetical protein
LGYSVNFFWLLSFGEPVLSALSEAAFAFGIEAQQDGEQGSESPERRTSVAEEG